jgi:hypothetical protein
MSTLSDLIALINSLIEHSRESQSQLRGAQDQFEDVASQFRAATVDSSSPLVNEGLGHLRAGLAKIEEAQRLLAGGDGKWESYVSVLGGGVKGAAPTLSDAARSTPPPDQLRGPAKHGFKPPTESRHKLSRITGSSRTKKRNTVIMPWVDVDADLEAIRAGKAKFHSDKSLYEINDRFWGIEKGKSFPASGDGFVTLTRPQYNALKSLIQARRPAGSWPDNYYRDMSIARSDWTVAAQIYRYHPRYDQGAL